MLGFLLTDYTKGLVYTPTTPSLNLTLHAGEALQFKKNNPNTASLTIPNLYGKTYQFDFPVDLEIQQSIDPSHKQALLQAKHYQDITSSRYQKCLSFSNLGFLSDYTLGAHKQLTQYFRIYHSQSHDTYHIEPKNLTTLPSDPSALTHESNLTPHEDTGIFLLLKEYVLGYDRTTPIVYKPTRTATPKSFDIGSAYDIQLPTTRRPDLPTIHIPGNYTAALRYQLLNKALQDWNADPSHRKYQRSSLLQTWQADALLRMGKRTVLLVPRRSGKTSLFALEILKEMLNTNYRSGTRPRTVLFISKDYDAVDQVMDYIQSLLNDFDWLKHMFHYDQVNHVFSLRTYDDSPQPKQVTIAQCRFLSALGKLPGVGSAADAVFFDEAMYIPTPVMENLMKIVDHEGARLLVMSTFYDDRPGQQLYYRPVDLCNKYEQQSSQINDPFQHTVDLYLKHRHNTTQDTYTLPDESVGLRYTVDDVDVIINKQHAKEALLDNPDSYMRQLYCRMLEKTTVFSYKHSLITSHFSNATVSTPQPHYLLGEGDQQIAYIPNRKRIVTAYDPALTGDMSAWLDSAYDQTRNKIIVFKEMNLNYQNKSSFIPQANIIKEHVGNYLSSFKVPILKSMDASHPGVSDAMAGQGVHFQYYYRWVGGNALDAKKDANKPNTWKVPKRLMVEAAQMLFDNNMVEIWSNQCPTLVQQLATFQQYTNWETGTTKYEGSTSNHDDFVATLLMVCWTWWNHLGLSRNKFEAPDEDSSHTSTQLDNTPLPIGAVANPYNSVDQPSRARYENIDIGFYY